MSLVAGNKLAELLVARDKDSALPASFPYVALSDDPEDPTRLHAIRLQIDAAAHRLDHVGV
jgi:hypothetical protein